MSEMSESSENEWLTMAQAAERLGVSPPTLRRWAAQGRINARRTLGGHRRIPASELPSIVLPEVPPRPRPGEPPARREELPHGRAEVVEDAPALGVERDRLAAELEAAGAENERLRNRLGVEHATVERLTRELAFLRRQLKEAMRAQAEQRQVILRLAERGGGGDAAGDGQAGEAARPGR